MKAININTCESLVKTRERIDELVESSYSIPMDHMKIDVECGTFVDFSRFLFDELAPSVYRSTSARDLCLSFPELFFGGETEICALEVEASLLGQFLVRLVDSHEVSFYCAVATPCCFWFDQISHQTSISDSPIQAMRVNGRSPFRDSGLPVSPEQALSTNKKCIGYCGSCVSLQ